MERKLTDIRVRHPEHGAFVARAVTCNLEAVQQAAKHWGLPWSGIARECFFEHVEGSL